MRYRPEIDGLRALAVLGVALFHIGLPYFNGGYIGVDVFFVISGYLITSIIMNDISKNEFSLLNFWERRIRRILPVLLVVIIFTLLISVFFLVPNHFLDFGQSLGAQGLFLTNYMFWREAGYFDNPAQFKPLLHTWSLSVEEQFYVIIPIVFFGIKNLTRKKINIIIVFLLLTSFLFSVYYLEKNQNSVFYFLPFRAWELLLGSCLALNLIPVRVINKSVSEILTIFSIGMIFLCFIFYDESTPFPGHLAFPVCFATTLFIWLTTLNSTKFTKIFFSNKYIVGIGKISYSFYLIHWPLLLFGSYIILRPLKIYESFALLLLSMGLSFFSWRYIEQPVRQKKIFRNKTQIFLGAVITLVTFFIVGGIIHINKGFPNRFNYQVNAYANGNADNNPRRMECHYKSNEEIQKGNLCETNIIDGSNQSSFLSWGDSHADAIMPLLEEIANDNNFGMYHASKNSCPPLLGISTTTQSDDECNKFNELMFEVISKNNIQNVILSARWTVYTKGRSEIEPLSEKDPLMISFDEKNSNDIKTEDALKTFERHLLKTINEITELDVNIWFLEQPPEQKFISPPDQLAQYTIRGKDVSNLGINKSDHESRENEVAEIIYKLSELNPRFKILSPDKILCSKLKCSLDFEGISIYRDDDHLTASGSRLLKPLFEDFINSNKSIN